MLLRYRWTTLCVTGAVGLEVTLMSGCTPTPVPTALPLPTVVAAASPTTYEPTPASTPAIDLNIGGGLTWQDDGGVAITLHDGEISATTAISFTLAPPCPGEEVTGTLVARIGERTWPAPLTMESNGMFRGAIDATDSSFDEFFSILCTTTEPVHVSAEWNCATGGAATTDIGSVRCSSGDLEGLDDPKGHVDWPTGTDPGMGCAAQQGIEVTLLRVQGTAFVPGNEKCHTEPPAGGWTFTKGALPADLVALVNANTATIGLMPSAVLTPDVNPRETNEDGEFAWDAPDGCYFVRIAPSMGCDWSSQVFGILDQSPVVDLNLTLANPTINACSQLQPSPCPTPPIP